MSLLLAIDAATPQSVVVVGVPGDTEPLAFSEDLAHGSRQASEAIASRMRTAVIEAGATMRDVSVIAVGRGPGTFTGARVAVATAKGLALGRRLDLHPFSTLEAIAGDVSAGTATAGTEARRVLATLDARKGEVYGAWYGLFDGSLAPLTEEAVAPLSAFVDAAPSVDADSNSGSTVLAGSGLGTATDSVARAHPDWVAHPLPGTTARGVWMAACTATRRASTAVATLDVTYLRRSYAELGIHPPKRIHPPSPFV